MFMFAPGHQSEVDLDHYVPHPVLGHDSCSEDLQHLVVDSELVGSQDNPLGHRHHLAIVEGQADRTAFMVINPTW